MNKSKLERLQKAAQEVINKNPFIEMGHTTHSPQCLYCHMSDRRKLHHYDNCYWFHLKQILEKE